MGAAAFYVLVTLIAGEPASAGAGAGDSPSYAMTYVAAPGCPEEAQLRADLDAHIHDRARARGARVEIVLELERGGSGATGELTVDDRAGNRQRRSLRG